MVLFLAAATNCFAQLEHVAPFSAEIHDAGELNGVVLVNTMDFHSRKNQPNLFPSSLQIIDPLQPWPPLFFLNAQPGGEGIVGNGAYQDFRYHPVAQRFSFFFGEKTDTGGTCSMYIICDTNLNVVDTFSGVHHNIDAHDFQISPQNEYLYMAAFDTVMDISALSGNAADTAVLVTTQKIEIADKNGNLIFSWNPFQHLPVTDMYWEYHLFGKNWVYKGMDWSHGNSVRFTHDGNIVYSFRFVGVGKISRSTGKLIWKLGGKSATMSVPQEAPYVLQHDFHEIAPGLYSVFSNGSAKEPCKAIVYSIMDTAAQARVKHIYQPLPDFVSKGLGSYNCLNNVCAFNYGLYFSDAERQKAFELLAPDNTLLSEYSSPSLNFSFQVHYTEDWKLNRPHIIQESGSLRLDETATEVLWYKIENLKAVFVGSAPTLQPAQPGTYTAVRRHGFGWLTAEPVTFTP